MQREIKFRGWDDESRTMLEAQDLSQSGEHWKWLGKRDVMLMQYTGLKDRTGKEIYEGDVVRAVAESQYAEQSGCFQVIFSFDLAWALANIDEEHGLSPTWGGWESLEVIGNIHENPDLLANN